MILLVLTNYLIQINQILNLDTNLIIHPTMKERLLTIHYLIQKTNTVLLICIFSDVKY